MSHNEFLSVSRVKENFKHGLTGRGWKSVYGLVNKSLRNRKGGATGYQSYEIRRQSFTLLAVLVQILAQSIQQLTQLRQIFSTGEDTLGLLRDINSGIRNGLSIIQIISPRFDPGQYGDLGKPDQVLHLVQDLYGLVPKTADARLEESQDQSVAESLAMHGSIYRYADQVDLESSRMLAHAQVVNPQGAGKLQAQSLAVLIGVTTQLLRTNSAMLKLMAENLALSNHKEKLNAEQFKTQYEGLSEGFTSLPTTTKLPTFNDTK